MERANWIKTQTLDDSTRASDPVFIGLSDVKLFQFQPEIYQKKNTKGLLQVFKFWEDSHEKYIPAHPNLHTHYKEHLLCGDSRAAIVVSLSPLLIAAYTDEFDCVAMLKFPDRLIREYSLKLYDRLLTINLYERGDDLVEDLENGPASYYRYSNFIPFIAEFLSDSLSQIELRKSQILESEWERTKYLAEKYILNNGKVKVRDGRPLYCGKPAQIDKNLSI
jgi:hypothetical protein